jgi:biotin carboxyl carrier protein
VGDSVEKQTQVLVLEAMKMENSITAGFAGKVSKIHITAGTSVEKNMPMMEFEQGAAA